MNTKPEVPIIDVEAKCLIQDSSLYFIYGHSEALISANWAPTTRHLIIHLMR